MQVHRVSPHKHSFLPCHCQRFLDNLTITGSVSLPFKSLVRAGSNSPACNLLKSRTHARKRGSLIRVSCEAAQPALDDVFYMRRCVKLARKAIGFTSPNPMVGCVIVRDGKIVGEGFHPKAGQPHAEVFALMDAGNLAENATVYVSLEPCNHHGRTPPCTEALIKAKVKRVVVGMVDPNPIVASKGLHRLQDAGIDVTVGIEEELCKKLNEAYIHKMLTGQPFVTLRYTLSVNGQVVNQLGKGVTKCGGYYSQLLQENDAIILSSRLTEGSLPVSQESGTNQPLQIVISNSPTSSIQVPNLSTKAAFRVIIFTNNESAVGPHKAQGGVETVVLDKIHLNAIFDYCNRQGLCSVLLDLRGDFSDFEELLKEGIEQKLIQKIVIEVMPQWDGCGASNPLLPFKSVEVNNLQPKISCGNIVVEGYFH